MNRNFTTEQRLFYIYATVFCIISLDTYNMPTDLWATLNIDFIELN